MLKKIKLIEIQKIKLKHIQKNKTCIYSKKQNLYIFKKYCFKIKVWLY